MGVYICGMEIITSLEDLPYAAKRFWEIANGRRVFAFSGELGAGKTTFITALCSAKEVADSVSSPTFSIINEYRYPKGRIYHIDLYRLNDDEEARQAGIEEVLFSGDICLVEWPSRAPGIFPDDTVYIDLLPIDANRRKIIIHPESI